MSQGKNEGKYLKSQNKRLVKEDLVKVREDLVKTALTLFLGEYFQPKPTSTQDTSGYLPLTRGKRSKSNSIRTLWENCTSIQFKENPSYCRLLFLIARLAQSDPRNNFGVVRQVDRIRSNFRAFRFRFRFSSL